jgi:hypothetical protein
MAFVPVNVKRAEMAKANESKSKWRSAEGWIFPDVKTTMQSNEHPRKPFDPTTSQEPWQENFLHANMMKSPLDDQQRLFFKHSLRDQDFNFWSQPRETNGIGNCLQLPLSIFEPGMLKEMNEKRAQEVSRQKWHDKICVDSVETKTHKILAATELKEAGFSSSNQLDKLKGLLKDEPRKLGLLTGGRNFDNIPALSVIKNDYEEEMNRFNNNGKGFIAGSAPAKSSRITDDKNRIPVQYYNRVHFEKINGSDFNFSGPSRSPIYKKRLNPIVNTSMQDENSLIRENTKYIMPNQNDINYYENYSRNNLTT